MNLVHPGVDGEVGLVVFVAPDPPMSHCRLAPDQTSSVRLARRPMRSRLVVIVPEAGPTGPNEARPTGGQLR